MSDAFREVDEELRKEYFQNLWRTYGPWFIGSIVAGILMVTGWVLWSDYVESERERESAAFESAIERLNEGDRNGAAEAFARIAESSSAGYAPLASFREAAIYVGDNDLEAAVAVYDSIAAGDDEKFTGLANLLAGMALMNADKYPEARARLGLISAPGSAWYYSATEMLALIDFAEGAIDEAETAFSTLAIDRGTPEGISRRVNEMLDLIDSERSLAAVDVPPAAETPDAPAADEGAPAENSDDNEGNEQ